MENGSNYLKISDLYMSIQSNLLIQLNERNIRCWFKEISNFTFDAQTLNQTPKIINSIQFICWHNESGSVHCSLRIFAYAQDFVIVRNVCTRIVARYSYLSKCEMRRCHQKRGKPYRTRLSSSMGTRICDDWPKKCKGKNNFTIWFQCFNKKFWFIFHLKWIKVLFWTSVICSFFA